MKTNYQCEKRKNILSILPLHRTFQVTEAKYSYYKKIHYYPCTAEESIIQRIKTEHRVSLTTASEFLCSVQTQTPSYWANSCSVLDFAHCQWKSKYSNKLRFFKKMNVCVAALINFSKHVSDKSNTI